MSSSLDDALTALLCAEEGKMQLDAEGEDPGAESKHGRCSNPEELLGATYLKMKAILN